MFAGGLNNAATLPPVLYQLQFLSPQRYGVESYFRVMYYDQDLNSDGYLDTLGYTVGMQKCHAAMLAFFIFFLILCQVVVVVKNRRL